MKKHRDRHAVKKHRDRHAVRTAWIHGRFEERGPDRADLLSGHGVFETIGSFDGSMPLWPRHLERLTRGAAALGIPCEVPDGLLAAARELLTRNGDDVVRVTLTIPAVESSDVVSRVGSSPAWGMTTRRRGPRRAQILLPVSIGTPWALSAIKTTARARYAALIDEARRTGADDALLVDSGGRVLETTTSNLFLCRGGLFQTPRPDGAILPGVARQALIDELRVANRTVEERDVTLADVAASDAMFTTNAVHGPRTAALSGTDPAPPDTDVRDAWRRAISA